MGGENERTPQKANGILQSIMIKLMPQTFSLLQRSQSSVEIKQNAKGNVEFTVKSYGDSIEEAQANGLQAYIGLKDKIKAMETSDGTE